MPKALTVLRTRDGGIARRCFVSRCDVVVPEAGLLGTNREALHNAVNWDPAAIRSRGAATTWPRASR